MAETPEDELAEISEEWLCTKRGGEFGLTLSRHQDVTQQLANHTAELWVTVDREGVVQARCTWRPYLGGLLVSVLENYRETGLVEASLASGPRSHGVLGEHFFPARSLRAYKQKFDPVWCPRWLAIPARRHEPPALAAVGTAYCPGGLRRALFRDR